MNKVIKLSVLLFSVFILGIPFTSEAKWSKKKILTVCDSLEQLHGLKMRGKDKEVFATTIYKAQEDIHYSNRIDRKPQFEQYLQSIFKQLRPNAKYTPRFYLYKSPYPNAFAMFQGDIFFNIGLISEMESEAALAYIMGHEITHFEKSHLFLSYASESKKKKQTREEAIQAYHLEQSQEYESDSIGLALGSKAGYNWEAGISNFYELMAIDTIFHYNGQKVQVYTSEGEKVEIDYSNPEDELFSTHPPTGKRITRWRKQSTAKGTKDFLVSASKFKALQNYARIKTLKYLANKEDNRLGIIRAFKYYGLEPDNKRYKYFLLEFIRRKVIKEPSLLKKKFLEDIVELKDVKGILERPQVVFRTKKDLTIFESTFLPLSKKIGSTYKDFRDFLMKEHGDEFIEFYLTKAILNKENKEKMVRDINKYIASPYARHVDYAKALKANKLNYSLATLNKKVVILNLPEFWKKSKTGSGIDHSKADKFNKGIIKEITNFLHKKGLDNYEYYTEDSLVASGIEEDYRQILLSYISNRSTQDNENRTGLRLTSNQNKVLQSPELWTFFYENGIAQVTTITTYSVKDKTVSPIANFFTLFKSITSFQNIAGKQKFFGATRNQYFFDAKTVHALNFEIVKQEQTVKKRLSKNLLLTEIYLSLK